MKVFILGLDGATWNVLKPLIDSDILPNIKKIVKNGCTAILESTIPPVTSTAWPCMATGMNPGKLGVFGNLRRTTNKDFTLKPVTSTVYKGKSFWDILSWYKYSVGLIKIPVLYPTYEVNGYMISGFGLTGKSAVYPRHLYEKIINGPSKLLEKELFDKLETLNINNSKECIEYIIQLKKLMREEAKIAIELIKNSPSDLIFYVISMTDWLQHALMDRIIKLASNIDRIKLVDLDLVDNEIIKFYKYIDIIVGNILNFLNNNNNEYIFFIVSDHGFTIRPYTFNIGKWLLKKGYMKIKENVIYEGSHLYDIINYIIYKLIRINSIYQLLKFIPQKLILYFINKYIKLYSKKKINISNIIDFKNSQVYCLEDHAIYKNPLSKNIILDKLANELKNTLKKEYNLNLIVFKCKEIYKGHKKELAPDLYLEIHDDEYIWEKSNDLNKPLIFKPKLPGIHDRDGIFIAYGPQIKKDYKMKKQHIYNIAPTILHIFNIPLNNELDGTIIKEIFIS